MPTHSQRLCSRNGVGDVCHERETVTKNSDHAEERPVRRTQEGTAMNILQKLRALAFDQNALISKRGVPVEDDVLEALAQELALRDAEEDGHPFHGNQWTEGAGIADYKPDRPLTGEQSKSIDRIVPGAKSVDYFQVPGLDKLHEAMGVGNVTGMSKDYAKARKEFFAKQPLETVPFKNLVYTQDRVNAPRVTELTKVQKQLELPVFVVRSGGKDYVMNGHHRVLANYEAGNAGIKAHVYTVPERRAAGWWSGGIATDRYQALGLPYPDPANVCPGQCEGTGWVPVYLSAGDTGQGAVRVVDEQDPSLVLSWYTAERQSPSQDGWHFVKCLACRGTGLRMGVSQGARTEGQVRLLLRAAGGLGSGNFGHAGRPGEVGGSTSGGSERITVSEETSRIIHNPEGTAEQIFQSLSKEDQDKVRRFQEKMIESRPEFEQLVTSTAIENGITPGTFEERATNTFYFGPVKTVERIAEKAARDYEGDLTKVTDVQRMTFVVDDPERAFSIYNTVKTLDTPGDIKDRMHNPLASGYRDVMFKPTLSNGAKVEVQVNTKPMLDAKEGPGHTLMVRMNRAQSQVSPEYQALAKASLDLYNTSWAETCRQYPNFGGC